MESFAFCSGLLPCVPFRAYLRVLWGRVETVAWSVVQTYPNASARVCNNLSRQRFEFYNPVFTQRVKVRGVTISRSVQLFQDYVFVFVVDRWRALKSTLGVAEVLMAGETPAVVPARAIAKLKAAEDDDGVVILGKSGFELGQRVQVRRGVFASEFGLYDGQPARERARVLMLLLGAQRAVTLDEDNLIAV